MDATIFGGIYACKLQLQQFLDLLRSGAKVCAVQLCIRDASQRVAEPWERMFSRDVVGPDAVQWLRL